VFFGRNWARILLMLSCVVTATTAFIGNANGSDVVTLATSLPTVGLSIMVLLALSSHRARDYATRGRRIPKRIAGRPYAQTAIWSARQFTTDGDQAKQDEDGSGSVDQGRRASGVFAGQ
jgi:hypothetical protein